MQWDGRNLTFATRIVAGPESPRVRAYGCWRPWHDTYRHCASSRVNASRNPAGALSASLFCRCQRWSWSVTCLRLLRVSRMGPPFSIVCSRQRVAACSTPPCAIAISCGLPRNIFGCQRQWTLRGGQPLRLEPRPASMSMARIIGCSATPSMTPAGLYPDEDAAQLSDQIMHGPVLSACSSHPSRIYPHKRRSRRFLPPNLPLRLARLQTNIRG